MKNLKALILLAFLTLTAPVFAQTTPAKSDKDKNTAVKLKADGTPDKRYSENKKLKKDGTPDKRYKVNKADTVKTAKKKN